MNNIYQGKAGAFLDCPPDGSLHHQIVIDKVLLLQSTTLAIRGTGGRPPEEPWLGWTAQGDGLLMGSFEEQPGLVNL